MAEWQRGFGFLCAVEMVVVEVTRRSGGYRRLDLTDNRIRFILAVHYLTFENQQISYVNSNTELLKRRSF